jgi:hypothetical protein
MDGNSVNSAGLKAVSRSGWSEAASLIIDTPALQNVAYSLPSAMLAWGPRTERSSLETFYFTTTIMLPEPLATSNGEPATSLMLVGVTVYTYMRFWEPSSTYR